MAIFNSTHTGTQIDKSVSQFNENGFLLHEDSGRAYVDVDFPIIIRTTGDGRPALNALIGNITAPQWDVGNNLVCEGQELIHGWDEGSPVAWHLHMITGGTDTTDRYVNFQVEYTYATLGSQVVAADTQSSGNVLIPANTPDRTHTIVPIHTFTPTEAKIGTQVYARLDRIATTGGALSPTADPFVSMLQIHILVNTMGSRNIGTK
jgi:hypothetical protein